MINVESLSTTEAPPSSYRKTLLSLMISLAGSSVSLSAYAQSEPVPSKGDELAPIPSAAPKTKPDKKGEPGAQTLNAVTITATRRREPAREVPSQVNVISTEQLQSAGAKSLTDYLANQPGVDVAAGSGINLNSVTIRGVSTGAQTIATVGTYIDDVAFGSSSAFVRGAQSALDMGLLDLNHIEVLRGPQGTLYGAGAMGGLLKYVTNEPDPSALSGNITLGGSTTHDGRAGYTAAAVVNVPLKEDVAGMRISLFRDHVGGDIDAVGPAAGQAINGGNSTGGRLSMLIEPSNRLKIRLTATAQETKRESEDIVDYDIKTGQPVDGDLKRRLKLREPYSTTVDIAGADIEYDFGWARLNSITSAQTARINQTSDYSGVYGPLLGGFGLNVDTVPVSLLSKLRKETQELRLTSQSGGQFEWLAGAFYTHEAGTNVQGASSTLPGGAAGPSLLSASVPSTLRETAFYGDVTWKPAPRLSVTGGIRIARNTQGFGQQSDGLLLGGATDVSNGSAETAKTYLGTISYALDTTSNVYVRAASGYRPGGPNLVARDINTGALLAPATFQHDTLWSYEAGYKADLLDKTLSIESSIYDIEWKQIQQAFAVNGVGVIVNGGNARVQGAELATTYRPSSQWNLTGSFAYIDARLTQDAPGLGLSGSRLPATARLAGALGATYNFAAAGHAAYVGATQRFVGDRSAGFDASTTIPNYKLPGYAMTDLQAGMSFASFQLALYVRNAFDKRAQLAADTRLAPLGAPVGVTVARPRTIGGTLSASF